ncbi:hypothetical protein [Micromonospora sp. DT31]|uniref:hypothetical protein n=1 Tax=Micromonospora sp. DT31 TaxID=3393434 RepID=UPI003CEFE1A5
MFPVTGDTAPDPRWRIELLVAQRRDHRAQRSKRREAVVGGPGQRQDGVRVAGSRQRGYSVL